MIRVTNNYAVSVDNSKNGIVNYVVQRVRLARNKETNETYQSITPLFYYTSLAGAVQKIADMEVAEALGDRDMDLPEAIATMKGTLRRTNERIKEAFGEVH